MLWERNISAHYLKDYSIVFPDYFSGHHHHPKNLEILFDWMNALFSRDILKFWNCFTYLEVKWRHSKWAMSAANNGIQYNSAFNGRVCTKKKNVDQGILFLFSQVKCTT